METRSTALCTGADAQLTVKFHWKKCARSTWPLIWAGRTVIRDRDWCSEAFDQLPTTNYISLRLNLSSNVLLKQVILLQKCGYFLWSVEQALYPRFKWYFPLACRRRRARECNLNNTLTGRYTVKGWSEKLLPTTRRRPITPFRRICLFEKDIKCSTQKYLFELLSLYKRIKAQISKHGL